MTHMSLHHCQYYTPNDVFVIQVALSSRKGQSFFCKGSLMISVRRSNDDCATAAPPEIVLVRLHHRGGVPRRACYALTVS